MTIVARFSARFVFLWAILFAGDIHAADYEKLYGRWQTPETPCNRVSFDSWYIDRTGVTGYESSCNILSVEVSGNRYTFEQECSFGMEEEEEIEYTTEVVDILTRDRITINGSRYNRCPAP